MNLPNFLCIFTKLTHLNKSLQVFHFIHFFSIIGWNCLLTVYIANWQPPCKQHLFLALMGTVFPCLLCIMSLGLWKSCRTEGSISTPSELKVLGRKLAVSYINGQFSINQKTKLVDVKQCINSKVLCDKPFSRVTKAHNWILAYSFLH